MSLVKAKPPSMLGSILCSLLVTVPLGTYLAASARRFCPSHLDQLFSDPYTSIPACCGSLLSPPALQYHWECLSVAFLTCLATARFLASVTVSASSSGFSSAVALSRSTLLLLSEAKREHLLAVLAALLFAIVCASIWRIARLSFRRSLLVTSAMSLLATVALDGNKRVKIAAGYKSALQGTASAVQCGLDLYSGRRCELLDRLVGHNWGGNPAQVVLWYREAEALVAAARAKAPDLNDPHVALQVFLASIFAYSLLLLINILRSTLFPPPPLSPLPSPLPSAFPPPALALGDASPSREGKAWRDWVRTPTLDDAPDGETPFLKDIGTPGGGEKTPPLKDMATPGIGEVHEWMVKSASAATTSPDFATPHPISIADSDLRAATAPLSDALCPAPISTSGVAPSPASTSRPCPTTIVDSAASTNGVANLSKGAVASSSEEAQASDREGLIDPSASGPPSDRTSVSGVNPKPKTGPDSPPPSPMTAVDAFKAGGMAEGGMGGGGMAEVKAKKQAGGGSAEAMRQQEVGEMLSQMGEKMDMLQRKGRDWLIMVAVVGVTVGVLFSFLVFAMMLHSRGSTRMVSIM